VSAAILEDFTGKSPFVITVDWPRESARLPDRFFFDLDRDRLLDDGEILQLRSVTSDELDHDLPFSMAVAEKVALLCANGKDRPPILVNIFFLVIDEDIASTDESPPLGISAWESLTGSIVLNGKKHGVTIEDWNMDGSYADFECDGAWYLADALFVHEDGCPPDRGAFLNPSPLRRRAIVGSSAFSVDLIKDETVLVIDPLDVVFGSARVVQEHLEATLNHPDWGEQRLLAGLTSLLPSGLWTVSHFSLQRSEPTTACAFLCAAATTVEIGEGTETVLAFDTTLTAAVDAQKRANGIELSLGLTTDDGHAFSRYYTAWERIDGIPFLIRDGAGRIVEEGLFAFG